MTTYGICERRQVRIGKLPMVSINSCSFNRKTKPLTAPSEAVSFGQRADGSSSVSHSMVSFPSAFPMGLWYALPGNALYTSQNTGMQWAQWAPHPRRENQKAERLGRRVSWWASGIQPKGLASKPVLMTTTLWSVIVKRPASHGFIF